MQAKGFLREYLGHFDGLLTNDNVIEICVNANGSCWVERRGDVHMAPAPEFDMKPQAVSDLAHQTANDTSSTLTADHPLLSTSIDYDACMLRVQALEPPAMREGTALSFRVFREAVGGEPKRFDWLRDDVTRSLEDDRMKLLQDVRAGVNSGSVDDLLKLAVSRKLNVIISGGTSTGKTELGRRMLWHVPKEERLITIEDAFELKPTNPNTVALIAERIADSNRTAELLLQATLRLRPDRIILGELRGGEAATFLEAINTGHEGSFTTVHTSTARKALDRLSHMVLKTGIRLDYEQVRRYLVSTIDLIIQSDREGSIRGVSEVYFPALEAV